MNLWEKAGKVVMSVLKLGTPRDKYRTGLPHPFLKVGGSPASVTSIKIRQVLLHCLEMKVGREEGERKGLILL